MMKFEHIYIIIYKSRTGIFQLQPLFLPRKYGLNW
jgi:hypothetical protein